MNIIFFIRSIKRQIHKKVSLQTSKIGNRKNSTPTLTTLQKYSFTDNY